MEKNYMYIYELYLKCSCNEGEMQVLTTKANYVYNIENINCVMLKYYPFHKENEQEYWIKKEQKHRLTDEYKEKFGEHYRDNLTPCKRQAVLKNYPFLTINDDKLT
jgi:hypothetical protein